MRTGAVMFHAPKGVRVSAAGNNLETDAEGWMKIPRGPPMRFEVSIPGPAGAGPVKTAATTTNER